MTDITPSIIKAHWPDITADGEEKNQQIIDQIFEDDRERRALITGSYEY